MSSGKTYSLNGCRGDRAQRASHLRARCAQLTQKFPSRCLIADVHSRVFELIAGPKDSPLGALIETIGIEQCALVVVAENRHLAGCHNPIDALDRFGP